MTTSITNNNISPTEYYLSQNYPNPFRGKTTIKYCIPDETYVKLTVFNSDGEMIEKLVDEAKSAGTYEVDFYISSSQSGLVETIYFYHLDAGSYSKLKKMTFLK